MSSIVRPPFVVLVVCCLLGPHGFDSRGESPDSPAYSVRQLTFGPSHHLFGYIGHAGTVPWNASGRFILSLRSSFQDHLPGPHEAADIVLIDTSNDDRAIKVESTRAWNLQQGTMFYWNPESPETQFFFNDRDPQDGTLFTVLFDITERKRIREYRFSNSPVANSGVAQIGGEFCALNYGRLARLRPVTGYAGLEDWSRSDNAPQDDGVFKVNVASGERTLLVSYRQLRDAVRNDIDGIDRYALFINHTLWNRPSRRIYFYLRANFTGDSPKVDIPFTINSDGSGLTRHRYVGGHPEWDQGNILMGTDGARQIRYDTSTKQIAGTLGKADTFPNPGGDAAWSPDREWFVSGHKRRSAQQIFFTFLRERDERVIQAGGFSIGPWLSGDLRIDPAPCWNRRSDQILFGAFDSQSETRQLFLLRIERT